jgi:uncharacterized protein YdhG (YjbR/CyaY superfamily)
LGADDDVVLSWLVGAWEEVDPEVARAYSERQGAAGEGTSERGTLAGAGFLARLAGEQRRVTRSAISATGSLAVPSAVSEAPSPVSEGTMSLGANPRLLTASLRSRRPDERAAPAQDGTMSARKATQKSAKSTTVKKKSTGFSDEERAAMKERAQELKAEARRSRAGKADGESDVLAKIAEMPEADRAMATRLHELVKASAPALLPKTWYGMPAYAEEGKVVCFFQSAHKFKSRYATFGFSDEANLDEGNMWPTSFALKDLTAAEEARIGALVEKAVS